MKILPNKHFREDFKKHYAENYDRIHTKLEEKQNQSLEKMRDSIESSRKDSTHILMSIIGLGFFALAAFILVAALTPIYNNITSAKANIESLQQEIIDINEQTMIYENIALADIKSNADIVAGNIEALQNMYLEGDIPDKYKLDAQKYFGDDYNRSWAENINLSGDEYWRCFPNKGCDFSDTAEFVSILYNNNTPVRIVIAEYALDDYKYIRNIEKLTEMEI